jgi:hypothetical protein
MYERYEINEIADIMKQAYDLSATPEQALLAMKVYELNKIHGTLADISNYLRENSSGNVNDKIKALTERVDKLGK